MLGNTCRRKKGIEFGDRGLGRACPNDLFDFDFTTEEQGTYIMDGISRPDTFLSFSAYNGRSFYSSIARSDGTCFCFFS